MFKRSLPVGLLLFSVAILRLVSAFSAEPIFEPVSEPVQKLSVGEKLSYRIQYLGIPVGRGEAEIREIVDMGGRRAYHVETRVRSYAAIDLIYQVRDVHHSYIDVEKLHSLKYEKNLHEGRRRVHEVVVFDQIRHTAEIQRGDGSKISVPVPMNVQDELSCGYWFRTLKIKPGTSVFIPVHADAKNWNLEVKLHQTSRFKVSGIGIFEVIEIEPLMEFEGIFFRAGKVRGWTSLDKHRVPVKMSTRIPILGNITGELIEYKAGTLE